MFTRIIAFGTALALSAPALAQESDLAKIREEIRQLKQQYEQRIQELEKRLADTEAKATQAQTQANKAQAEAKKAQQESASSYAAAPPPVPGPAAGRGETAVNPAISLILQGTFARESQDPNNYQITGFIPSGGEVGPPKRSFSLGETELNISANIDPYFRGVAIAALAPEGGVNVEEAYFQTLALPKGLTLKGGRYFSSIGYLNDQHQHAWDFQNAPLAYKSFLANQLQQNGVQLKWVAPTDLFIELGAEASAGDNFPGSDRNKNGVGGYALFGHVGGDIGDSYAWRAGASYLKMSPSNLTYQDVDALGNAVTNAFSGSAKLWIADAVLKWSPNGNATYRNFKLQGEYFRFIQDGSLSYNDSQGSAIFGSVTGPFSATQTGGYVQGIWQFMPAWRIGYRYDRLNYGSLNNGVIGLGPTAADFPVLANHSPTRNSVMLDWSPTEFSRVRLQFASDKSRLGLTDNQTIVQYIYSLGAHGAHKF